MGADLTPSVPHLPGGLDREAVATAVKAALDGIYKSEGVMSFSNGRADEVVTDLILALPNPRAEALEAEVERLKGEIEDLFLELPDDIEPFDDEFDSRVDELGWCIARTTNDRTWYRDRAQSTEAALKVAVEALENLIKHFEAYGAHDAGAFKDWCPDCIELGAARQALSALQGGGNG